MSIITYLNTLNTNIYPKMKLCKPNRIVVSPLKDIYNLELNINLGNLNSLSFTIPTKVERDHELVDNPLVELIRDRYQIRMNFNNQTEYFVVLRKEKSMSNDGNSIVYHAYSLGKELDDKDAPRGYSEDGKNLSFHANILLRETNWRIGFVDSKFNLTYRTVEVSTETVLSSIIQLAEKFNALILWDTVNRIINFHQPNNIGLNRGVRLKEGLLLESLSVSVDGEQVKTRLKGYGQDGLEFRNLSPTGSNYIEDFSYFMYPFEADVNYNVIKSSNHMTDELCIAILKYRKLLDDSQGQFANLRQQKTNKQADLVNLNQELRAFENELKLLKDERDVINYTYADNAPARADWLDVISRINAKNTQITNKNNQITTNNNQLTTIQNNLTNLENLVKVENNYTVDEILELNNFIFVGEYTNDSIIDEQDLLDETIEVFKTINEPPLDVTVSLEGYLTEIDDTVNLNLISIGDTIRVNNDELQVNLRLKIIGIKINFDNDKIDLTIANGKDIINDDNKLIDMIYSASSTSNAVDIDKYKWNKGEQALDEVTRILNSEFDTAKNILVGGVASTIQISERGIYNRDFDDPNVFMVINSGQLVITPDGGNTVSVAISKNGCIMEDVVHKKLYNSLEVI